LCQRPSKDTHRNLFFAKKLMLMPYFDTTKVPSLPPIAVQVIFKKGKKG